MTPCHPPPAFVNRPCHRSVDHQGGAGRRDDERARALRRRVTTPAGCRPALPRSARCGAAGAGTPATRSGGARSSRGSAARRATTRPAGLHPQRLPHYLHLCAWAGIRRAHPAVQRYDVTVPYSPPPSPSAGGGKKQRDERDRRADAGDVARARTARRLMVVRLRVRIARLEVEQPSDPRIGQARRDLRVLTRAARDTD